MLRKNNLTTFFAAALYAMSQRISSPSVATFEPELRPDRLDVTVWIDPQLRSPLLTLPLEILELISGHLTLSAADAFRHTCKKAFLLMTSGREIKKAFDRCASRYPTNHAINILKANEFDSHQLSRMRQEVVLEHCAFRKSTFRVPSNRYTYDIKSLRTASMYATVAFSTSGRFLTVFDSCEVDAIPQTGFLGSFSRDSRKPNAYFFLLTPEALVLVHKMRTAFKILGVETQESPQKNQIRVFLQGENRRTTVSFTSEVSGLASFSKAETTEVEAGLYNEQTAPSNLTFYTNLGQGRIAQRPQTKLKTLKRWHPIRKDLTDANLPSEFFIQYDLPSDSNALIPNLYIASSHEPLAPRIDLTFDKPGKLTHFAFLGSIRIANQAPTHACSRNCLSCWDDLPVYFQHRSQEESGQTFLHTRFVAVLNASEVYLFDIPQSVFVAAMSQRQAFSGRKFAYASNIQAAVFTAEDIPRFCLVSACEISIFEFCFGKTIPMHASLDLMKDDKAIGKFYKGFVTSDGEITQSLVPTWRSKALQYRMKGRIEGFSGGNTASKPAESTIFGKIWGGLGFSRV